MTATTAPAAAMPMTAATPIINRTAMFRNQHANIDPKKIAEKTMAFIGLGTVGGNAMMDMFRAGLLNAITFDEDDVEQHNVVSSPYGMPHLGMSKSVAAHDLALSIAPDARIETNGWAQGDEVPPAEVIGLFPDSIDLRRELFEANLHNYSAEIIIDVRMGGWVLQAWCVDPKNEDQVAKYRKTLHSTDRIVQATCGTRTFAPVGSLSGAIVTSLVAQHLSDDEDISPPFYTYIDLSQMEMRTSRTKS